MSALRTARERARSEVTGEILATARLHLAEHGAAGLSLRAVARDLGLVSSAVYRYFPSRDHLLTALIVAAYDSLGDATEASIDATTDAAPRDRWVAAAGAIRAWALGHRHEYALLYGTPVPGYAAPDDTVGPGTRVSLALLRIVRDTLDHVEVDVDAFAGGFALSPGTERDLVALTPVIAPELAARTMFDVIVAWTQLFGLLSFELFGQTRGIVTDHAALFHDASLAMAVRLGL